jgi:hypothetical protein
MEIQKFSQYQKINEEFIGGLIKGALGKLFNLFAAPFKDMANDIKKMFKEDDLGTIKDIIMTNFNQAIDSAQKEIPKVTEDGALTDIMPKMIDQLVQLANNIEKDVTQGLGKDKTSPFTKAARAVILGNKEAKWPGLVGALDPNNAAALKENGNIKINYKFNKAAYDKALADAAKGGIKGKQAAATKFLDTLQKDVAGYIEKELTDEELKDIYSKAGGKEGGGEGAMDYTKLKEFFDKKTPVIYLLKDKKKEDYDPKKKPEEQTDVVGVKVINALNDQNKDDSVTFLDKDEKPNIKKSYADIIGPAEAAGENAKKAAEVLGKIKQDEEKMGKVVKFAEFMQDDKNKDKVAEIEKMMGGQAQA